MPYSFIWCCCCRRYSLPFHGYVLVRMFRMVRCDSELFKRYFYSLDDRPRLNACVDLRLIRNKYSNFKINYARRTLQLPSDVTERSRCDIHWNSLVSHYCHCFKFIAYSLILRRGRVCSARTICKYVWIYMTMTFAILKDRFIFTRTIYIPQAHPNRDACWIELLARMMVFREISFSYASARFSDYSKINFNPKACNCQSMWQS